MGTLRIRFIFTAMISLFILIIILISGIAVMGYYRMEESADNMLQMLSGERRPPEMNGRPQYPAFGYRINPQVMTNGYFIAVLNDSDKILTIESAGMSEITEEEAVVYVSGALSSGEISGKIGSYKYLITGVKPKRIIFIDNSMQVRTLINTITSACLAGFGCMVLMFVILFFVSGRVLQPIERNMEKQRQFVSNAGHEIKTPLGIIMANTDALELHTGENKWINNIRSQTERMTGLMNQLLLLARMDEGISEVPFADVELHKIIKNAANIFTAPADTKHIRIIMDMAENIVIQGDSGSIEQLISILFDNAVKYTDDGGNISVSLISDGKKCRIIFTNTIKSFPDSPPSALFDRFYRADAARTQKAGGYGIGLSVAYAIVKMHGGKIDAAYLNDEKKIQFTVEFDKSK